MPTEQTNLTSETGRNAAGLGHDVAIALKDAMVAAACATAPVAAPDDAWSDKQAAGPPAAATRNVLSLLRRCWRLFQERRLRQRLRVTLRDLTDRELMDIGVTSAEIDYIAAQRTLERLRDGTAHLWTSRRVK